MATFYYGGQAVMEGVMMRGRRSAAMAIRRPDGSIYLYEEALNPRLYQNRLFRLPFLRGMLLLWEMLVLGTRLMTLSANIATGALDPDAPAVEGEEPGTHQLDIEIDRNSSDVMPEIAETPPQIGGGALVFTLLISLGFAVAVFFLAPLLIAGFFSNQIGGGWLNLTVEGLIRLGLLIGYLYLIGRVPDIQRIFGYTACTRGFTCSYTLWYGLSVACRCCVYRGVCFCWLTLAIDQDRLSSVVGACGSRNSL